MWTYDYQIQSTDLLDYCTSVRIPAEAAAGKRGGTFSVPGIEGDISYGDKTTGPLTFPVECTLRYTNSAGAVVHADGAAGHAYENYAELKRLFYGTTGLQTLTRTAPHQGANTIDFEVLADTTPSSPHFRMVFLCRAPKPFWAGTTFNSYSSGTGNISPGGNAVIDDAVLTFTGDGKIELDSTGDSVEISGSGGATVVVDCGARTVKQAAVDKDAWVIVGNNRWFRMFGGITNAVTVTGTVQVQWYDKWR